MKRIVIVSVLAGLVLAGGLAAGALAQQGTRSAGQRASVQRGEVRERIRHRLQQRGQKLRAFARQLDLSRPQLEQALATAQAAEPIARELRKEIAQELVRRQGPRTGEQTRGDLRARVRELRQQAFARLEPQVQALIAGLTPEQRQRIEDLARRHGRTFDADRLAKRLAFVLSRPMAAPLLEARLGR